MYPVFLHLKQVPCLVVGAGAVAQRRIFALLEQDSVAIATSIIAIHTGCLCDQFPKR